MKYDITLDIPNPYITLEADNPQDAMKKARKIIEEMSNEQILELISDVLKHMTIGFQYPRKSIEETEIQCGASEREIC